MVQIEASWKSVVLTCSENRPRAERYQSGSTDSDELRHSAKFAVTMLHRCFGLETSRNILPAAPPFVACILLIAISATTPISLLAQDFSVDDRSADAVQTNIAVAASSRAEELSAWNRIADLRSGSGAIKVAPTYYGDVFNNTRGGISTNDATSSLGLWTWNFA